MTKFLPLGPVTSALRPVRDLSIRMQQTAKNTKNQVEVAKNHKNVIDNGGGIFGKAEFRHLVLQMMLKQVLCHQNDEISYKYSFKIRCQLRDQKLSQTSLLMVTLVRVVVRLTRIRSVEFWAFGAFGTRLLSSMFMMNEVFYYWIASMKCKVEFWRKLWVWWASDDHHFG